MVTVDPDTLHAPARTVLLAPSPCWLAKQSGVLEYVADTVRVQLVPALIVHVPAN